MSVALEVGYVGITKSAVFSRWAIVSHMHSINTVYLELVAGTNISLVDRSDRIVGRMSHGLFLSLLNATANDTLQPGTLAAKDTTVILFLLKCSSRHSVHYSKVFNDSFTFTL